jgi:hypothetical protein
VDIRQFASGLGDRDWIWDEPLVEQPGDPHRLSMKWSEECGVRHSELSIRLSTLANHRHRWVASVTGESWNL